MNKSILYSKFILVQSAFLQKESSDNTPLLCYFQERMQVQW